MTTQTILLHKIHQLFINLLHLHRKGSHIIHSIIYSTYKLIRELKIIKLLIQMMIKSSDICVEFVLKNIREENHLDNLQDIVSHLMVILDKIKLKMKL